MTYLALASLFLIGCTLTGGLVARAWHRKPVVRPVEYQPAHIVVYSPNPELILFTQWQFEADAPVLYEKCADELECWCAQVDLYQWNESAELYQLDEQWSEAHEHRLRRSLGEEV